MSTSAAVLPRNIRESYTHALQFLNKNNYVSYDFPGIKNLGTQQILLRIFTHLKLLSWIDWQHNGTYGYINPMQNDCSLLLHLCNEAIRLCSDEPEDTQCHHLDELLTVVIDHISESSKLKNIMTKTKRETCIDELLDTLTTCQKFVKVVSQNLLSGICNQSDLPLEIWSLMFSSADFPTMIAILNGFLSNKYGRKISNEHTFYCFHRSILNLERYYGVKLELSAKIVGLAFDCYMQKDNKYRDLSALLKVLTEGQIKKCLKRTRTGKSFR